MLFKLCRSRGSPTKASEISEASSPASRSHLQDTYVSGLLQQVKLLELEISYLKQHPPSGGGGGAKDHLQIDTAKDNSSSVVES